MYYIHVIISNTNYFLKLSKSSHIIRNGKISDFSHFLVLISVQSRTSSVLKYFNKHRKCTFPNVEMLQSWTSYFKNLKQKRNMYLNYAFSGVEILSKTSLTTSLLGNIQIIWYMMLRKITENSQLFAVIF